MGAVGPHSTGTTDGAWDGPAAEASLPSPMSVATGRAFYAWIDDAQVTNGEMPKSAGKFGHHTVSGGTPGAANIKACQSGIGILHGGRGGTTIPSTDEQGVYDHLAKHIRDAGLEPPAMTILPFAVPVTPPVDVSGAGYETLAGMSGTPWAGVLAVEGVETGDGRQFADGALSWMDEPMPLRWNVTDSHGGTPTTQTVTVGRIDQAYRDPTRPNYIMGRGVFDDSGVYGAEALRQVREGFLSGVSIDPDSIKDADVELVYGASSEVFHLPGKHNQKDHGRSVSYDRE